MYRSVNYYRFFTGKVLAFMIKLLSTTLKRITHSPPPAPARVLHHDLELRAARERARARDVGHLALFAVPRAVHEHDGAGPARAQRALVRGQGLLDQSSQTQQPADGVAAGAGLGHAHKVDKALLAHPEPLARRGQLHAAQAHARAAGAVPHCVVEVGDKLWLQRLAAPRTARRILLRVFLLQRIRELRRRRVCRHHDRGLPRRERAPNVRRAPVHRHGPCAEHVEQLFGHVARGLRVFKAEDVAVLRRESVLFLVPGHVRVRAPGVAQAAPVVVHLFPARPQRVGERLQKRDAPGPAIGHKAREKAQRRGVVRARKPKVLEGKVLHVHVRARVHAHADNARVAADAGSVVLHRCVDLQRARTRAPEFCQRLWARRGAEARVVRERVRTACAAHWPLHVGHTACRALPREPFEHVRKHSGLFSVRGGGVVCETLIPA